MSSVSLAQVLTRISSVSPSFQSFTLHFTQRTHQTPIQRLETLVQHHTRRVSQRFPETFHDPTVSAPTSSSMNFSPATANDTLPYSVPSRVIRSTVHDVPIYTSNAVPVAPNPPAPNLVDENRVPRSIGYFPETQVDHIPPSSVAYQTQSRFIPSIQPRV